MIESDNFYALADGRLVHMLDHEPRPIDDAALGILFDSVCGTLLKHGAAARVEATLARQQALYRAGGLDHVADGLVYLRIPVARLTPAMLEEINRTLAVAGFAATLAERLAALPPAA
jgi:hypothetical protein